MIKIKKANDLSDKILNFLYFIFPITFLIGNGAINTTVLLIVLLGITNYFYNIISFKDKNVFYLLLAFFLLLGFSTLLEINGDIKNDQFIKFIKYLRFFLFFFKA